ncbi:MAG: hypothetical protein HOK05_05325 [Nitrosopumilus sp.]|jgi:hypothetical protein|nr:hypothetical protein [Nitrosopumilus sp.]
MNKSKLKAHIELYQTILPSERERLHEMKIKMDNLKEFPSFLSTLRLYLPFGLQSQYNKLGSWIDLYTERLSQWEYEYENE